MPLPNHNASPEFGPSFLGTAARFADAGPPDRPSVSRGGSMPGGPHVSGRRVLVVEDEFVIALDLQLALYRLGCEVLGPVASVAEALVLLRHERPDAAVLDINVTSRDTRHLADRLLRDAPT